LQLSGISVSGSSVFLVLTPLYLHLLADARTQATVKQEYRFAVMLAHAACDLATEGALGQLLQLRKVELLGDYVLDSLGQGKSLDDRRARKLYATLTGENPAGDKNQGCPRAPWWDSWETSRKLRHHVVYAGQQITRDQALACIDASEQYVAHLAANVARLGQV
jgi:hypothetical protein